MLLLEWCSCDHVLFMYHPDPQKYYHMQIVQEFPKGGFCEGEISIIGVVCAPVATINFAPNPCKNLWVHTGFNKEALHKKCRINYCNRCAHDANDWDFPLSQKPPFGNPLPSDTKLLLTKNYSEIIILGKLRISRVIPWKCRSFLDILRA